MDRMKIIIRVVQLLTNLLDDIFATATEEQCESPVQSDIKRYDSLQYNEDCIPPRGQPMFFGPPLGVQRYDKFKYPHL